ncbi:hypothetical protein [Breoghania sp.]|uniref:hypothetical protein n=1 Tax=Breoghania sp. TaxID=2065378 RepID=UPI0026165B22|nr:hypothetical protein [Breoghania sp.]MDJ0930475.1 hypothetical protein [Breoghania sp.]
MDLLTTFMPPDLSPAFALTLVFVSFLTSGMTAAVGLGGVALLAVMAFAISMAVLIPVHGVIQLGSNAGRMIVQARHIDRSILLYIAIGSLVGAWVGGHVVMRLPDAPLKIALTLFVL